MNAQMFKSRIVGSEDVDPNSLDPHALNFRIHPAEQRQAMNAILDAIGWVNGVTVSVKTRRILNGHLRVEEAKKRGVLVPVRWVDVTEEEEDLILATFDRIGGMAEINHVAMRSVLDSIGTREDALNDILNSQRAAFGIIGELEAKEALPTTQASQERKPEDYVIIGVGMHRIHVERAGFEAWASQFQDRRGDGDMKTFVLQSLGLEEFS